jgi:inosine-uridine nucleoside N-ribohydrolase
MMCGAFTFRQRRLVPREWKAKLDYEAAALTYHIGTAPVHRTIPLDVTSQVVMDANEVRKRFQHKLLQPVLDFAEVWFEEREQITFHDPLAAATIFDDQICRFKRGERLLKWAVRNGLERRTGGESHQMASMK